MVLVHIYNCVHFYNTLLKIHCNHDYNPHTWIMYPPPPYRWFLTSSKVFAFSEHFSNILVIIHGSSSMVQNLHDSHDFHQTLNMCCELLIMRCELYFFLYIIHLYWQGNINPFTFFTCTIMNNYNRDVSCTFSFFLMKITYCRLPHINSLCTQPILLEFNRKYDPCLSCVHINWRKVLFFKYAHIFPLTVIISAVLLL